ncbi:Crp/Fnr family transcriptional regulator [Limnochorda pilosa]|uniref:Crp/Fnr family transcriptional regulator n=1 Tax=Limnochorda pilosa TaxID=1555112 RepID=A0A0K2SQT4_LIMPI|nr:Crp/Fnr family transcriptional regulator [Limnochorda pilosa]BAS29159.1 Crp/Fnr family transcriptional regulator [Limnochorda pilosa]
MSLAPLPGPERPGHRPRASDPEEVRRLLRSHAFFAPLGEEEREGVLELSHVLRLRRNGVLYTEGEPARSLYLLLSGRVKVVKHSPDGREQTLQVVDPGETFNEAGAVGGTHVATAVALHSSRVLQIPSELLRSLVRSGGPVADAVVAGLAGTVGRLAGLAADLSLLSVTARVARLLLTREDCLVGASGGLSQQEMASLAGTARQVVGRILRRMEEQGVIDLDRGRIRVLDPGRLEQFAQVR